MTGHFSTLAVSGLPAGKTIFKSTVHVHLTGATLNSFGSFAGFTLRFPNGSGTSHAGVDRLDNSRLVGTALGSGCAIGAATSFDVEATDILEDAPPPYSGTFRSFQGTPDLGNAFRTGDAAAHNGTWETSIGNYGGGTIVCWGVDVYVCETTNCPIP